MASNDVFLAQLLVQKAKKFITDGMEMKISTQNELQPGGFVQGGVGVGVQLPLLDQPEETFNQVTGIHLERS